MDGADSERLDRESLSEATRVRLMRLIAQGELAPGARLNEAHLAARFGISRGPLREAARELEGEGVLVSRPRQGFFVAQFTRSQIVDLYEAKRWLEEAFIADLSAHTDISAREAIAAQLAMIDVSDRLTFSETLLKFRLWMCSHIHNRFLAELMVTLYRRFHIIGAVVEVAESSGRQDQILSVLQHFWRAMVGDDIATARAIMAADTAYWLADLPSRFPLEATYGPGR